MTTATDDVMTASDEVDRVACAWPTRGKPRRPATITARLIATIAAAASAGPEGPTGVFLEDGQPLGW